MSGKDSAGALTFRDLEQQGWAAKASTYQVSLGKITSTAVEPLLDAARVGAGLTVLDVACGPGYGVAGALARGATPIGLDFAPAMVAEARRMVPGAEFREGDAENLPFMNGTFDTVICLFGLLHFAEPERAIAEAYRVLRSRGRYAFTVWGQLESHQFLNLVLDAIQTHGKMDVPLPPAPPFFRFSERKECRRVLAEAGFLDISFRDLSLVWRTSSASDFLQVIYQGTVRTAVLLERQAPKLRDRIHQAIIDKAEEFRSGDTYQIGWSALLVTSCKP